MSLEGRPSKAMGSSRLNSADEARGSDNEASMYGFGHKISDAKTKLNESSHIPRTHPLLTGLAVFTLVFTVAIVSVNFIHDIARHAFHDAIRSNLKRLARASATLVDPEVHKTFLSPKQENSPEYLREADRLARFQDSDTEIAFVYTCVLRDGKVFFVLDPTPAGDTNNDGVDDKSHIMQEYPEATAELIEALKSGVATVDMIPYQDRWGKFISGYAPIRDSAGQAVGIVGVDLSSDHYENRLASLNDAYDYGIVVALMLAILSGLTAGVMQFRSIGLHALALHREEKYRQQIALTLERLENALKIAEVSRNRFSDLFEGIPVSCLTIDTEGNVFEWNSLALATFGLKAHASMEQGLEEVLGEELLGTEEAGLVKRMLGGEVFENSTWTEGRRTFLVSGHPLFGPDGSVTGGILAAVDITRQKEAEERVQQQLEALEAAHRELNIANAQLEMATTDMLTGLPNRRAFYEALDIAIKEARRGRKLTLVQMDIDFFKRVNDTYGHHAGDIVLQQFAKALKAAVRPQDLVARHGGEEFFMILRDASLEQALMIVERVRAEIAETDTGYGAITASFGVAEWHSGIESDEALMLLSDQALYEAKNRGRNCAVVAEPNREAA
jgi:diguanylate cyclase (GGDEF)-like protein/PAS domain S-box-containing protein